MSSLEPFFPFPTKFFLEVCIYLLVKKLANLSDCISLWTSELMYQPSQLMSFKIKIQLHDLLLDIGIDNCYTWKQVIRHNLTRAKLRLCG